MSISRKRKKELRKLQNSANKLWESQQVIVGEAATIAREAGRQLGNYSREQVVPTVRDTYDRYAAPTVDKTVSFGKHVFEDSVVPAVGGVVGHALSVWDTANDTRSRLASGRGLSAPDLKAYKKRADKYGAKATKRIASHVEPRRGMGAGGVIAIVLGAAAALGVLYAAWQTLRADDELWVADDPLATPES